MEPLPHASLESAALSAVTGESDSSQSLADSISTSSARVLGVPEAVTSDALTAMAQSMAQSSGQLSLWNTQELAARCCSSSCHFALSEAPHTSRHVCLPRTCPANALVCMLI